MEEGRTRKYIKDVGLASVDELDLYGSRPGWGADNLLSGFGLVMIFYKAGSDQGDSGSG